MNRSNKVISALKVLIIVVMAAATGCVSVYMLSEHGFLPQLDLGGIIGQSQQEEPPVMPVVSVADVISQTDVSQPERQPVPEIIQLDSGAQEALGAIAADYDCAAVQIAVINDGYVTNTYCYGYADVASERLLNDDTKIRIASLSKVLVGMAAMKADEEGSLDLDGSLTDQLGYTVGNPSYTSHVTTLRDILTHTATFNDSASIAGRSLQNYIQDRKSYFYSAQPGTAESWAYSNGGIRVAGGIVEVLTDTMLHDYSDQHFFDPLGVDASFYARLLDDTENLATLYFGNKTVSNSIKQQLLRQNFDTPAGNCTVFAGGLTISAKDYAKLICLLLRDGEYDGRQYFEPETVADMEEVRFQLKQYDQCTVLRHRDDLYGRELYFHTGVAYGVLAFAAYDQEANEGFVIVTNGAYRNGRDDYGVPLVCAEMAEYILNEVLDGKDTSESN